jgi:hypothetical protein
MNLFSQIFVDPIDVARDPHGPLPVLKCQRNPACIVMHVIYAYKIYFANIYCIAKITSSGLRPGARRAAF